MNALSLSKSTNLEPRAFFGIEAAREKALVKSGHVTPQILDIFVTWPYYGYASTGVSLYQSY